MLETKYLNIIENIDFILYFSAQISEKPKCSYL